MQFSDLQLIVLVAACKTGLDLAHFICDLPPCLLTKIMYYDIVTGPMCLNVVRGHLIVMSYQDIHMKRVRLGCR